MSPSTTDRFRPRRPGWRLAAVVGCALAGAAGTPAAPPELGAPVLRVDFPFPTADKPQSKLWHAEGRWWALLPRSTGPSLWERAPEGWREWTAVAETLRGVPGRADVWHDAEGATAVTVADRMLAVVRLSPERETGRRWRAELLARLPAPVSDIIETATLARDGAGDWWIAAPIQGRLFVWSSRDARRWSEPFQVAGGLHVDDIGLVTKYPGGVAVVWSDQKRDAVRIRVHLDGDPVTQWGATHPIAEGDRIADDHLHAALEADGTLWLATKTSSDRTGEPQLALHVRRPEAPWSTRRYAPLTDSEDPTRPIVLATARSGEVLLGHVVSRREESKRTEVVFGWATSAGGPVLRAARVVISPTPVDARVNDISGAKAPLTEKGPWIVLASDGEGRVYEADLRSLLPAPLDTALGNPQSP